ncbi:hypothetical protein, partial [Escherichia coli]|uniref:hypothetical protein n=1 Tax=Escherichia coli TaxID=562 RepID=UPI0019535E79
YLTSSIALAMGSGFLLGFWRFILILILKMSWRIAYFGFWNKIYDWLYVTITIIYQRKSRLE